MKHIRKIIRDILLEDEEKIESFDVADFKKDLEKITDGAISFFKFVNNNTHPELLYSSKYYVTFPDIGSQPDHTIIDFDKGIPYAVSCGLFNKNKKVIEEISDKWYKNYGKWRRGKYLYPQSAEVIFKLFMRTKNIKELKDPSSIVLTNV